VNSDRNYKEFKAFVSDHPWPVLSYHSAANKHLRKLLNVTDIPKLIFFQCEEEGGGLTLVTDQGRELVMRFGGCPSNGKLFEYLKHITTLSPTT
jgi:hypothetical protein